MEGGEEEVERVVYRDPKPVQPGQPASAASQVKTRARSKPARCKVNPKRVIPSCTVRETKLL